MPCICWYDPGDQNKKHFKSLCQSVVDFIKEMEKGGDPLGISVKNAQELITHLYNPDICQDRKKREKILEKLTEEAQEMGLYDYQSNNPEFPES